MMPHAPRLFLSGLLAVPVLAGCTVGPDFARPAVPSQTGYLAPRELANQHPAAPVAQPGIARDQRWWTQFGSPLIDTLVDRALANNPGLAASNATLAAAREQLAATRGTARPQVDANARVDHEQVNLAAFGFGEGNPEFDLYSVGGGISYDLDLFGGRRRQIERAGAETEAQLRQTEAAHLAIAGQVVQQALRIAAIRARISASDALIAEDQRNVDLTRQRRAAGEGTLVEVLNAQSQYENDRGETPQLQQQLAEARHLLAVLTGVSPSDFGDTDFDLDRLRLPRTIPVSLPSTLVRERPDILQAEAALHAATAQIGIAEARLYPSISLGGALNQESPELGRLFSGSFLGFDLFGGITAPVFHGGALKAEKRAAVFQARASAAIYRQTVLEAFRQVADLLKALDNDAHSVATQREAMDVAQRSRDLSKRSFEVGNSGLLQVLDSERLYQRARLTLVDARARQLINVARLYVATAGGWSEDALASPNAAAPVHTPPEQ